MHTCSHVKTTRSRHDGVLGSSSDWGRKPSFAGLTCVPQNISSLWERRVSVDNLQDSSAAAAAAFLCAEFLISSTRLYTSHHTSCRQEGMTAWWVMHGCCSQFSFSLPGSVDRCCCGVTAANGERLEKIIITLL